MNHRSGAAMPTPARLPSQAANAPSARRPAPRDTAGHAALHQAGRLTLRGDPTELHRHRAHCSAARNPLHRLQTAVEAMDAFLSPRFFSMLAVLGAGAGLALWLSV
jgi:hypothetical protein